MNDTSRRSPARRLVRAVVAVGALAVAVAVAPSAAQAVPTGFVMVKKTVTVLPNSTAFPDLSCPAGKTTMSGGFERSSNLVLSESRPLSSEWHAGVWNTAATVGSLTVHAVCASVENSGRPSDIADVVVQPKQVGSATAVCPLGWRVSGGGLLLDDFPQHAGPPADLLQGVTPYWSEPDLSIQGWTVKALNLTRTPRLVRSFVICTSTPGSRVVQTVGVVGAGESVDVTATCPAGTAATAGGWAYEGTGQRLERSLVPSGSADAPTVPVSWTAGFVNTHPVVPVHVRVTALCTPA